MKILKMIGALIVLAGVFAIGYWRGQSDPKANRDSAAPDHSAGKTAGGSQSTVRVLGRVDWLYATVPLHKFFPRRLPALAIASHMASCPHVVDQVGIPTAGAPRPSSRHFLLRLRKAAPRPAAFGIGPAPRWLLARHPLPFSDKNAAFSAVAKATHSA